MPVRVNKEELGFLDYFSDLEDPRIERCRLHPVPEILLLTLCGVISGCEGWDDLEHFGKAKLEYLRTHLEYKNGIPSDDTLRRFFRALDPKAFQERFILWVNSLQLGLSGKVIALDGKTSRRSFDGAQGAIHMVSAFASEAGMVLGQTKVNEKSNEIKAIPELLEWLEIRGAIITIDAMGCQKVIAEKIIERGGDYILALKGNQSSLHEEVEEFFQKNSSDKFLGESFCETSNKGHGRIEKRSCSVSESIEWLKERHSEWKGIKSIIRIESRRNVKGKESLELRYYISSLEGNASKILSSIRQHWGIENSLHWVLDMSFGEDQSRIRKDHAPTNLAVIRHCAINMIRKAKTKRQTIKGLRKQAGWKNTVLENILSQHL